jgi:hypothetical protein
LDSFPAPAAPTLQQEKYLARTIVWLQIRRRERCKGLSQTKPVALMLCSGIAFLLFFIAILNKGRIVILPFEEADKHSLMNACRADCNVKQG